MWSHQQHMSTSGHPVGPLRRAVRRAARRAEPQPEGTAAAAAANLRAAVHFFCTLRGSTTHRGISRVSQPMEAKGFITWAKVGHELSGSWQYCGIKSSYVYLQDVNVFVSCSAFSNGETAPVGIQVASLLAPERSLCAGCFGAQESLMSVWQLQHHARNLRH